MPLLSRKIILASAREDVAEMESLLSQQGLDVHLCSDGARALELSLSLFPDLMVLDTDIPLLPASHLVQILLANPRTEKIAFFFIGHEGEEVGGFRRHKDRFMPRPFNCEQLFSQIINHYNRIEHTEQVGRQEKEIRGNLDQISLVDLIQVLGVNRKDGVLSLNTETRRGTIFMRDGRVVNARVGRVEGMKAFFRLLNWEEGDFWFSPGAVDVEVGITDPVDHLIIEGLRQYDEMVAQEAVLPRPETFLVLKVPRDRLPRGMRPATQEIIVLIEYYPQVKDLLDHCPRSDFEILQILKVLLDKGVLEEMRDGESCEVARTPLLSSKEIIAIKDHLGERDALLEEASAKLILLAANAGHIRQFVQALQGISEFEPSQDFLLGEDSLGLGDVGRLVVTDTFSLRFFSLPATAETAPLWTPFCRRLFGVVSLSADGSLAAAEEFFRYRGRAPVAAVNFDSPCQGAFTLKRGDRQSFRALLAYFATRFHRLTTVREEL